MNLTRRSLWLQEALSVEDRADAPRLEGDARADVVIIGGGFTGLWTALRLKEHDAALDVALIDRDICGGGVSGRNGGFALSWWPKYLALEKLCGSEEAVRLARASQEAVDEVGRFCAAHAPGADFRRDGWLWAATSNAQMGAWTATVEALGRRQVNPFIELESAQVARRTGSPRHLAGVMDPQAATVQPARYARGLRQRALELGVRVFEHSPMRRLKRTRPPVVETARGRLTADKVVIANNAWSIQEPELRKAIVVTSSDMVATGAVRDWLESVGRIDGLAISDSRLTVHYYRTTSDGRMVFGKGGGSGALAFGGRLGPRFDGTSPYADEVERWMRWTYPDMPGVPRAADWTGPIDKTKSGLPLFGGLANRADILYGVGFSGNGVGPTVLAGRILASLVLGLDDEWARCGLVRAPHRDFPPEPVRYVGGKLVRLAVKRLDEDQDAGRKPNLLVRRLASLAPVALSPVKSRAE